MPGSNDEPEIPDFPAADPMPRSRWRMQLVWLVPIVAVLIGGGLAVKAVLERGEKVSITFKTGEGLEAGKTKLKYKDVDIGVVEAVMLSPDQKHVVARAEVARDVAGLLVDNTRFWVVRPRVSGGTVSGLGTLLSGSYIDVDVGNAKKARRDFIGLEEPPVFASDMPGREFTLKSAGLGSLDVGSPVYFRRLQVGQIASYQLDKDGKGVTLKVFINAPYDRFVKIDTRFWHASGINMAFDSNGVRVETQSIVSVIIGGVAFESPPESQEETDAEPHAQFELYPSRTDAMKQHDRIIDKYVVNFTDSVRGLTVGAPVDFRGIVIGEVTAIYTRFDPTQRRFSIPVEIQIYPERFTSRFQNGRAEGRLGDDPRRTANALVENGFRFQLKSGNLLTGQLYIGMDYFPDAPKATIDWSRSPPELPAVPRTLQSVQDSVTRLLTKLNGIPFEAIGEDARTTLRTANSMISQLNTDVVPRAHDTLTSAQTMLNSANSALQPDSSLQQSTEEAMREMTRTAAALRTLADYLSRHPESLVRGKPEDKQ
ncbi:PqiB family protein [Paraburkholderia saeva]|uniref:Intermembrane transport protein PqiB n=1 Tax=Paraburkholderia saeva TaxID=2777537 RepID=A0A9N8RY87_9BURK|nr:MlaD family protein [Paraburkholderia saeva]CAG4892198.1 Intermembrane transport protein PqiB [Paraburkholderia saeva]CAG4895118.1 Intermembrane transport protein PqiB [Paraburkholderia saeva]CAG4904580.1 Intermembrane transport protein PqiB [Paraburkholderia saeva]